MINKKRNLPAFSLMLWSSTTSAWIFTPRPSAARAPLQHQVRHTTDLAAKVGDYFRGSGGDEEDPAEAAREARESLERMWASSAGAVSQEKDAGDDQLLREVREALPGLEGERADGDSAKASPDAVLFMDRRLYHTLE